MYLKDMIYEDIMANIRYYIKEAVGIIAELDKVWKKGLNLISQNGNEDKYDLREWSPGHEKMGTGITLTIDDLRVLKGLLNEIEI